MGKTGVDGGRRAHRHQAIVLTPTLPPLAGGGRGANAGRATSRSTRAMFLPTLPSASSHPNTPKRSNSGTTAPSGSVNVDRHISEPIGGISVRIQTNRARSLSRRYTCTPSGRSSASVTARPVSSASSRTAAPTSDSPGSACPFGMSHRGEREAWPSNKRSPSVTMTPHEMRFAISRDARRSAWQARRTRPAPPQSGSRANRLRPSGAAGHAPRTPPPPSPSPRSRC